MFNANDTDDAHVLNFKKNGVFKISLIHCRSYVVDINGLLGLETQKETLKDIDKCFYVTEKYSIHVSDSLGVDNATCHDCDSSSFKYTPSSPRAIYVTQQCESIMKSAIINQFFFSNAIFVIDMCCGVLRIYNDNDSDRKRINAGESSNFSSHLNLANTIDSISDARYDRHEKAYINSGVCLAREICYYSSWHSWMKYVTTPGVSQDVNSLFILVPNKDVYNDEKTKKRQKCNKNILQIYQTQYKERRCETNEKTLMDFSFSKSRISYVKKDEKNFFFLCEAFIEEMIKNCEQEKGGQSIFKIRDYIKKMNMSFIIRKIMEKNILIDQANSVIENKKSIMRNNSLLICLDELQEPTQKIKQQNMCLNHNPSHKQKTELMLVGHDEKNSSSSSNVDTRFFVEYCGLLSEKESKKYCTCNRIAHVINSTNGLLVNVNIKENDGGYANGVYNTDIHDRLKNLFISHRLKRIETFAKMASKDLQRRPKDNLIPLFSQFIPREILPKKKLVKDDGDKKKKETFKKLSSFSSSSYYSSRSSSSSDQKIENDDEIAIPSLYSKENLRSFAFYEENIILKHDERFPVIALDFPCTPVDSDEIVDVAYPIMITLKVLCEYEFNVHYDGNRYDTEKHGEIAFWYFEKESEFIKISTFERKTIGSSSSMNQVYPVAKLSIKTYNRYMGKNIYYGIIRDSHVTLCGKCNVVNTRIFDELNTVCYEDSQSDQEDLFLFTNIAKSIIYTAVGISDNFDHEREKIILSDKKAVDLITGKSGAKRTTGMEIALTHSVRLITLEKIFQDIFRKKYTVVVISFQNYWEISKDRNKFRDEKESNNWIYRCLFVLTRSKNRREIKGGNHFDLSKEKMTVTEKQSLKTYCDMKGLDFEELISDHDPLYLFKFVFFKSVLLFGDKTREFSDYVWRIKTNESAESSQLIISSSNMDENNIYVPIGKTNRTIHSYISGLVKDRKNMKNISQKIKLPHNIRLKIAFICDPEYSKDEKINQNSHSEYPQVLEINIEDEQKKETFELPLCDDIKNIEWSDEIIISDDKSKIVSHAEKCNILTYGESHERELFRTLRVQNDRESGINIFARFRNEGSRKITSFIFKSSSTQTTKNQKKK